MKITKSKSKNKFSIINIKRIMLFIENLKIKKHQNIFQIFKNKKHLILWLILVSFLIIIGIFYFWINFSQKSNNIQQQKSADAQSICLSQAGHTWCLSEQKCLQSSTEFCNDAIVKLVSNISENTGINFVNQGKHNFAWSIKIAGQAVQDKSITGDEYVVNNIKLAEIKKIENYLSSVSNLDKANIVNGISGGLRGYRYYNLICSLNFRYRAMKINAQSAIVPVADSLNAKFSCGPAPAGL